MSRHLALAALLSGCAATEPQAVEVGAFRFHQAPVLEMTLDDGYVQFVDHDSLPNNVRHLRGKMTVRLYDEWATIHIPEDDSWHVVPRARMTYAGTWNMAP